MSNGEAACAAVRFSTADFAPREQLDAWREIYGRTLAKLDIEPLSSEPFHVEATLRRVPGLGLMTARRSPALYHRRREFIDHDDVGLAVGLTAGYEAQQLGHSVNIGRGQAIVVTGAEPALVRTAVHGDHIMIRAPLRALALLVDGLADAYGRPLRADNTALRLLIRYIGILEETETLALPDLRQQAVTHIHDLMALAIGATRDAAEVARHRGARAARLRAIKQDVTDMLDQPDLSVATIALRHRLKPRWVQRLFESDGTTFTDFVLTQRLARAHRLLTDPRHADRKISAIALNAGFGDLSYFNRAFRRRYGAAPSELRTSARSGDDSNLRSG